MANITFNTHTFNSTELNFDLIVIVEDPLAEALKVGLFSTVVIGSSMGVGNKPRFFTPPRRPTPSRRPG